MKIVQFGLRYSPNVGDGIISDCLSHACRRLYPDCEITTVDLSGRRDFGQETVRNRTVALRVLRALPRTLRQRVVMNRLNAMLDQVERDWLASLEGADLAWDAAERVRAGADPLERRALGARLGEAHRLFADPLLSSRRP